MAAKESYRHSSLSDLPLGQRLLEAGLLTQDQLDQALREQQSSQLKFGEICLEYGWISPAEMYTYTPSQDLALGEILVILGYLEFDQLRVALAQQRRFGRRLGEILVWKGWLQVEDLEEALHIQQQVQQQAAPNAWQALHTAMPTSQPMLEDVEEDPESLLPASISELVPLPDPPSSPLPPPMRTSPPLAPPVVPVVRDHTPEPYSADPKSVPRPPKPKLEPSPWSWSPQSTGVDEALSHEKAYQDRIAELEQQLQARDQEWDVLLADMNQQIQTFQDQYTRRIHQLEEKIRAQQELIQDQTQNSSVDQAALLSQVTTVREQLEQAQTQAHEAESELLSTQAQLARVDAELHQTQTQLQQSQLQLQHHQLQSTQEINRLKVALETQSQSQVEVESQTVDMLHHQIEDLQSALAQAQAQAQQTLQEFQSYRDQVTADAQTAQSQLRQLQHQLSDAIATRRSAEQDVQQLQAKVKSLKTSLAVKTSQFLEAQRELSVATGSLQTKTTELDHVQKQLISLKARYLTQDQRRGTLSSEVEQTRELLATYRQTVASLSQNLQSQQVHNRLLQTSLDQHRQMVAAVRMDLGVNSLPMLRLWLAQRQGQPSVPDPSTAISDSSPPDPSSQSSATVSDPVTSSPVPAAVVTLDTSAQNTGDPSSVAYTDLTQVSGSEQANPNSRTGSQPTQTPVLTPWARTLFFNLQEASLITDLDIDRVLEVWHEQGGRLTHVLADVTGLQPATVKFFSDGGSAARLSGGQRLGDYLKLAGLVTEDEIVTAIEHREPDQRLGEALAAQGYIPSGTANYFVRNFVDKDPFAL